VLAKRGYKLWLEQGQMIRRLRFAAVKMDTSFAGVRGEDLGEGLQLFI